MLSSLGASAVAVVLVALSSGCEYADGRPATGREGEVDIMEDGEERGEGITKIGKSDAEWRSRLTAQQFRVTRRGGTERAFTGQYWNHKGKGVYACVGCGLPLFGSEAKFDSGTGWPSYRRPVDPEHVAERKDASLGVARTEILCARCDAHLGHVFDDGPEPTGRRYCVNSASLDFRPAAEAAPGTGEDDPAKRPAGKAMFAAGCFWGVEAAFSRVKGVRDTDVGYSGGRTENPTYRQVCTNGTGHAEAVLVEFDPEVVSYDQLLDVFWNCHDPTQLDRQGPDVGSQYRSAIFYLDEDQKRAALASKARLERSGRHARPIATEIVPASAFHRAEEYHQRYYDKRGLKGCAVP